MWPDRRLLDLFKTEFPIVQAPMAGVMDADLVIAAAQGGALGSLPCATISVEKAREQINIIRQRVSAPVNLNFFVPSCGRCRSRPRGRMEKTAGGLLCRVGSRSGGAIQCSQSRAVRRGDVRTGRGIEARGGQLPFWLARSGAIEARQGGRLPRDLVGDHRARSRLAGGARGRCHHRARRGSRRPSRHVSDREYFGAARDLCPRAAGGGCRARAGDRVRRHRRRARHRGCVRAGSLPGCRLAAPICVVRSRN